MRAEIDMAYPLNIGVNTGPMKVEMVYIAIGLSSSYQLTSLWKVAHITYVATSSSVNKSLIVAPPMLRNADPLSPPKKRKITCKAVANSASNVQKPY